MNPLPPVTRIVERAMAPSPTMTQERHRPDLAADVHGLDRRLARGGRAAPSHPNGIGVARLRSER
jgi:hypothetical protein